ncbi:MAG: ATP-binding protein [Bifidobacteriaceae bacterium]|nr:ATP-binding protein [Bifidobacteriaceae bacterium]
MGTPSRLVERRLLAVVLQRLSEEPVVLIQGPRSVGKSTLLRQVAARLGGTVVDADDPATRAALRADPAAFVDVPGPVLIDEYQRAPEALDAIKTVLNRPPTKPGRYVLTGSARHEALPQAAQALTGRLHRLPILPLAQCELANSPGLLGRLFDEGEMLARTAPPSATSRQEYIERVARGGFPLALNRSSVARSRWFDDYIRLTLERDVSDLRKLRQAQALPEMLAFLASQTAQLLKYSRVGDVAGLDETTAASYVRLLEAVFLVQVLPAWGKRLTSRTAASPKIHFVDSGLAARLSRLTAEKLDRRDATALTELGHLVETFAVGELLKEASWMDGVATTGHWRTFDGHEVDLVVERDDGLVVAFEVKASGRAAGDGFRGLAKLRDQIGAAFGVGVLLYLGERSFRYGDRLLALPLDRLWTPQ